MAEQPPHTQQPQDLWRVYRREWAVVYSLNAVLNQQDPLQEDLPQVLADGVSEYFERHYAGRVADDDVRFGQETLGLTAHAQLELFLPTMKAEFKNRDDAVAHAAFIGAAAVIVQRNSTADHDLLSYGVTKLPAP